ncbi:hypothetical protein [Nonlabens ponticola]|uniref:Uncharacterized protein n=1 Tax=Nonlabens ponticola TaxID=2496866 RepID=A0A3S9MYB6_9FLAO|nr:hypothetical protein [Nonlabens ponticola]AZQ44033.1 hypothetical protein EJ995_07230 [Nonlabens ponticola]
MKKLFSFLWKAIAAVLAVLVLGFLVLKLIYNDDVPQGESGKQADELALKMLDALNSHDFEKADYLEWTFRGVNHYQWYMQENQVTVSWDDKTVKLNTKNPGQSIATRNSTNLTGEQLQEAIDYALKKFNNDSFWMVAPYKVMDPGTKRELVVEDGVEKLLIKYTSGGSTPGDAYLWELDENYRPTSFKMWVSIIPLDGIEARWNDWYQTENGYYLANNKNVFGIEIPITGVSVTR